MDSHASTSNRSLTDFGPFSHDDSWMGDYSLFASQPYMLDLFDEHLNRKLQPLSRQTCARPRDVLAFPALDTPLDDGNRDESPSAAAHHETEVPTGSIGTERARIVNSTATINPFLLHAGAAHDDAHVTPPSAQDCEDTQDSFDSHPEAAPSRQGVDRHVKEKSHMGSADDLEAKDESKAKGKAARPKRARCADCNEKKSTLRPIFEDQLHDANGVARFHLDPPLANYNSTREARDQNPTFQWAPHHPKEQLLLHQLGYFGRTVRTKSLDELAKEMIVRMPRKLLYDNNCLVYGKNIIIKAETEFFKVFVRAQLPDDSEHANDIIKERSRLSGEEKRELARQVGKQDKSEKSVKASKKKNYGNYRYGFLSDRGLFWRPTSDNYDPDTALKISRDENVQGSASSAKASREKCSRKRKAGDAGLEAPARRKAPKERDTDPTANIDPAVLGESAPVASSAQVDASAAGPKYKRAEREEDAVVDADDHTAKKAKSHHHDSSDGSVLHQPRGELARHRTGPATIRPGEGYLDFGASNDGAAGMAGTGQQVNGQQHSWTMLPTPHWANIPASHGPDHRAIGQQYPYFGRFGVVLLLHLNLHWRARDLGSDRETIQLETRQLVPQTRQTLNLESCGKLLRSQSDLIPRSSRLRMLLHQRVLRMGG